MSIYKFVNNYKLSLSVLLILCLTPCLLLWYLYAYSYTVLIVSLIVMMITFYAIADTLLQGQFKPLDESKPLWLESSDLYTDEPPFDVLSLMNCPAVELIFDYYRIEHPSLEQQERIRQQIRETFAMNNINLWFNRVQNHAKHSLFYYTIKSNSITDKDLLRYVGIIERELGVYGININTRTGEANTVAISVPHDKNKQIGMLNALEDAGFQEFLLESLYDYRLTTLPVVFGYREDGTLCFTDLHKQPSMLIAGASGSGKSTLLHSILSVLLAYNTPDTLELYLVDTKIVELAQYQKFPHVKQFVSDHDRFESLLDTLLHETNDRYDWLNQSQVQDIGSFNRKMPPSMRMPFVVLVLEEMGDLILYNQQVQTKLIRLLQKGRAAGVHVIAATQRPSSDIISGSVKANMPCRVALRVASGTDSRIILDKPGAEALQERGAMIVYDGGNYTHCSGIKVDKSEMQRLASFWH